MFMKRLYPLALMLAMMLAACTSETDITMRQNTQAGSVNEADLIQFSTYMSNSAQTRAGAYGAIDTDKLQGAAYGFGVFAYYTQGQTYANYRTKNAVADHFPLHMYNEKIIYNAGTGKWGYAYPQNEKAWPNEFASGPLDDQNNDSANDPATGSTSRGNVSFFAYAPYAPETTNVITEAGMEMQQVEATAQQGTNAGIVAFSRNNFNGIAGGKYSDAYLKYIIPTDADKQVDLLWGTTGTNSDNVLGAAQLGVPTADLDGGLGRFNVNADLTKQKTNGTVSFIFKHALAKIGGSYVGGGDGSDNNPNTPTNGLMAILDIDKDGQESGGSLQPYVGTVVEGQTEYNTKVTINEITLTSEKQLTDAGVTAIQNNTAFDFNDATYVTDLYNTGVFNLVTGVWTDHKTTGTSNVRTQTILPSGASYHGSTDDDVKDAVLNANVAEPTSFSTTEFTQARYEELPIGVTTFAKNVYANDVQPFVFIPGTHPVITVTITYTVRTYDAKLARNYSEVEQKITKRLYFLDEIELNKQYNVLLHLGLTTMKFTASVSDWEVTNVTPEEGTVPTPGDGSSPVATYEDEVEHIYLPKNVAGN